MLVGEVRIATTGSGSDWKLSGASQCVSAVTNRSKKCPVPASRSAWPSARALTDNGRRTDRDG